MPPSDSSALIVARFLKSNHYTESYNAFISEAGLPANAGDVGKGDLTLETLLEEKKTFDLSVRFEKLGTADHSTGWSVLAPSEQHIVSTLPSKSNLLSTSVETFIDADNPHPILLASSADRRLHILDVPGCSLRASLPALQDSPILSCAVLNQRVLLTTSMSGQLVASDLQGNILDQRRDHSKYIVKVATYHNPHDDNNNTILVATAGWDNKLNIYHINPTNEPFHLGQPTSTIPLPSKPESLLFIQHLQTSQPILLVSRADSSHIYYYTTESPPRLLGKQNLAPHSNAWVAFTPSALALCPTDETRIAVGTNSLPHMKLLIVRLLIPPWDPTSATTPSLLGRAALLDDPAAPATETQASQARAALAVADREAAAVEIHCTTLAPQTPYSTPAIAWRADGSGVWVNGDDGAVRGVEASTGKVVETLHGHEEGSKVRCLWAGRVDGEEWLVSGGFDQRLVVWRVPQENAG